MRILVSEELRDDGIPTVTISVNAPGSARDAGTTCGRVEPTQAVISC